MSRTGLFLALGVALVAGLAFGLDPDLDLRIAALFENATTGRFDAGTVPILNVLRRVSMWVVALVAAPAVIALVGKLIFPRRKMLISGSAMFFLISTLILAPGILVNGILKEHGGRPRPAQVTEFGGERDFVPWWDFSGSCPENCSFVSGEGSAAFWTMAPAALAPPQWRAAAYGAAIAYGLAVGVLRMAFGGHFASDVIFAGVFTFLIIWAAHGLIYRWRTRLPDGAVESAVERFVLWLRGLPSALLGRRREGAPPPDKAA